MQIAELLLHEYTASRTQFSQVLNDSTIKMGFECEMYVPDEYSGNSDYDDDEYGDSDDEYEEEERPDFNEMTFDEMENTDGVSFSERSMRRADLAHSEWVHKAEQAEWQAIKSEYTSDYMQAHPKGDQTDAYHSWRAKNYDRLHETHSMDAFIEQEYGTMDDFMSEFHIDWESTREPPERSSYGRSYGRDNSDTHRQMASDIGRDLGVPMTSGWGSSMSQWKVIPDGSLNDGTGAEVVSAVYPLKDGLDKLQAMFQWMSDNDMETTSDTGLHVSFSIDGITSDDDYDFLKMMVFFDENYTASIFGRMKNQYAKQMRNVLFRDIQGNDPATLMSSRHIGSVIAALKHMGKGLPSQLGSEKYYSFRHRAKGVVEFRNMGDTDYNEKFDIIRNRIINMAYVMKVGSDDKLMQREYLTRIFKMLTSDKYSDPALVKKKPIAPVAIPSGLNSFGEFITKTPALTRLVVAGNIPQLLGRMLQLIQIPRLSRLQLGQLRMALAQNKMSPASVRASLGDDAQYNQLASKMRWPLVVPGEHDDAQEPLPFAMRGRDLSGTPSPPATDQDAAYRDQRHNWNQNVLPPGAQSTTRGLHQNARTAAWGRPRPRRTPVAAE